MAKNSIRDYSATAASNTDIQSVDIDENCPASGINNAIRELMVDLKNVSTGAVNLETPAADQLNVDNLRLDGNTISSTDTNGDITLDPDGTGDTIIASGNLGIGTASPVSQMTLAKTSDLVFTQNGYGIAWGSNNGSPRIFGTSGGSLSFKHGGGSTAMTIDSSGNLLVGRNTASGFGSGNGLVVLPTQGITFSKTTSTDLGAVAFFNRNNGDGNLIEFAENAVVDGSIAISGTTVSFNGGHLSRWSQAADGNRISGLVKGTVMTNLDQMAVWHHEAQAATYYEEGDELPEGVSVGDEKTPAVAAHDEDNEQLNCMAVSSVEGDANVAGVFVSFDESDDFNDMFVAMTGDMVIRIAQGTTVARGDLLMSAGDGTAKPQGDDIVRSKTIAKVTSTTVSHTYDDGSYLVPCVLMAC